MANVRLAATATGMMLWACAAQADVVVTTPPQPIVAGAWVYPEFGGITGPLLIGGYQDALIDLNGDRVTDLHGSVLPYLEMRFLNGSDTSFQPQGGGVSLVEEMVPLAPGSTQMQQVIEPLGPNTVVGPESAFGGSGALEGDYHGFSPLPQHDYGDPAWNVREPHYVGFRLTPAPGATYYGWIRMDARGIYLPSSPALPPYPQSVPGGVTVYQWAIETSPDTPITTPAPEPGCAGLIALATAGGLVRRRTRR